jgi:hypothetical protein
LSRRSQVNKANQRNQRSQKEKMHLHENIG